MNSEHVTPEIAKQRLTIHRNQVTAEEQTAICKQSSDPTHCSIEVGFGLSWQIAKINNTLYLNDTGSDPDVKTLALFDPGKKPGIVIFTDGPGIANLAIRKILAVIFPDPVLLATFG
jgi:hypothetical protein